MGPRENKGGKYRPTAAMAAGIVDRLWKMEDLFDSVMEVAEHDVAAVRSNRLLEAMRRLED